VEIFVDSVILISGVIFSATLSNIIILIRSFSLKFSITNSNVSLTNLSGSPDILPDRSITHIKSMGVLLSSISSSFSTSFAEIVNKHGPLMYLSEEIIKFEDYFIDIETN